MLIGNILKYYCLKSLLPTLPVILEEMIFTSMFGYIIEDILFVFFVVFFCTLQLLSAAFDIHMSFGKSPPIKVRNVFSDISKSFDKV